MTEKNDGLSLLKVLHDALTNTNAETVNIALVKRSDDPPVITIPTTMSKLDAAKELERQWKEEETVINVNRHFEDWKWQDCLVAIKITAEEFFGWIDIKQSLMNPPTEIQIIIDWVNGLPVKQTCFYGQFKVAAFENATATITPQTGGVSINFEIKKKYKARIEEWYGLIDKRLKEHSIYHGKSVMVSDDDQFDDMSFEIIETHANPFIILNDKEESVLSDFCSIDLKEAGKRTYLFYGAYGNGKTEAVMILGDRAKQLGMTFFNCKHASLFTGLLTIAAKHYSPCLIFMEDLDEIGSGNERNEEINELLNTLDGAETKNKSIKVVVTTNHHENINPALRRPGRIDLMLKFENPTPATARKIYQKFFAKIENSHAIDYDAVMEKTPDCSGAFIAEISKRAIRLAELNDGIGTAIVIGAINSIVDHLEMMNGKPNDKSAAEQAMEFFARAISEKIDLDGETNSIGKVKANINTNTQQQAASIKKMIQAATIEILGEVKKRNGSNGSLVA